MADWGGGERTVEIAKVSARMLRPVGTPREPGGRTLPVNGEDFTSSGFVLFVTLEPNESADDDLPRNVAIITRYGAYRFHDGTGYEL